MLHTAHLQTLGRKRGKPFKRQSSNEGTGSIEDIPGVFGSTRARTPGSRSPTPLSNEVRANWPNWQLRLQTVACPTRHISQTMFMIFGVMIRHKMILTHTKFDQVWLGNSQEEWICCLGTGNCISKRHKIPLDFRKSSRRKTDWNLSGPILMES